MCKCVIFPLRRRRHNIRKLEKKERIYFRSEMDKHCGITADLTTLNATFVEMCIFFQLLLFLSVQVLFSFRFYAISVRLLILCAYLRYHVITQWSTSIVFVLFVQSARYSHCWHNNISTQQKQQHLGLTTNRNWYRARSNQIHIGLKIIWPFINMASNWRWPNLCVATWFLFIFILLRYLYTENRFVRLINW